mmetsp:Transcript_20265/g.67073  ORF Transcript_20265/g.67073 Transcript_20265/m.67073 type:complete len:235 (+) Transcript_20265:313-1017(+)
MYLLSDASRPKRNRLTILLSTPFSAKPRRIAVSTVSDVRIIAPGRAQALQSRRRPARSCSVGSFASGRRRVIIGSTARLAPACACSDQPPTRPVRPPGLRRCVFSPERITPSPPASRRVAVQSIPCSSILTRGKLVLRGAYSGASLCQGTCSSFTFGRSKGSFGCCFRASRCGSGMVLPLSTSVRRGGTGAACTGMNSCSPPPSLPPSSAPPPTTALHTPPSPPFLVAAAPTAA